MAITIKSCICGCSLRTGVLVWLWLATFMAVLLILSEVDYLVKDSKYPNLYWFHILQLVTGIGWTIVNIITLGAIYQNKRELLVPFLWFSVSSIIVYIFGLCLLVIFWSDVLNSRFASEYLQELIIAEDSSLNSTARSELYEKIKEMIKKFGFPWVIIVGVSLLAVQIYVTIATYSLYLQSEPEPQPIIEPEEQDRIISVEIKKRRSQFLAHSVREIKPILNVN